jgi:hypothetical protein
MQGTFDTVQFRVWSSTSKELRGGDAEEMLIGTILLALFECVSRSVVRNHRWASFLYRLSHWLSLSRAGKDNVVKSNRNCVFLTLCSAVGIDLKTDTSCYFSK